MLQPAALLAATLMLTGCVPSEVVVSAPPEPSITPIFASDEDALAAATEAYAKYLEVSDLIASEGGFNPERISPLVSADRLKSELQVYSDLAASGSHQKGVSSFDGARLQQVTDDGNGSASITLYVCLDQTTAEFINSDEISITPPKDDLRSAFEVRMSASRSAKPNILLEGMERWSGSGIC